MTFAIKFQGFIVTFWTKVSAFWSNIETFFYLTASNVECGITNEVAGTIPKFWQAMKFCGKNTCHHKKSLMICSRHTQAKSRKKYVSLFFNNKKIAGLSTFGWGTHFFKGGKVGGNNPPHEVSNPQQRENITKPKPTPPIILMKVLGQGR